jgi:hypothetical protein
LFLHSRANKHCLSLLAYRAANSLQRLLLILIPLLAIAFPVLKTIPDLMDFKEKNSIYLRYGVLKKWKKTSKRANSMLTK